MTDQMKFDDRPPIDVSRFDASNQSRLLAADHALGALEVAVTGARNSFREMVASDDLEAKKRELAVICVLLSEAVGFTAALHATFAAFETCEGARGCLGVVPRSVGLQAGRDVPGRSAG